MNLTSQVHTNNRQKKPRTGNMGSDGGTKIDCTSKEPGSCAPRLNTQYINTKKLNRPFTFKQIVRTACRRTLNAFLGLFFFVVTRIPYFHFLKGTQGSPNPCLFRYWFWQNFLGLNRTAYWTVHFTSKINQSKNILVGIDSAPGHEPGATSKDWDQFASEITQRLRPMWELSVRTMTLLTSECTLKNRA